MEQGGVCQFVDSKFHKGLEQCHSKHSSARPFICKLIGVTRCQKDVGPKTRASKASLDLCSAFD